ncbi:MAG: hypothetical protein F4X14_20900 [Caldilineaceae bacterium SB0661_bin_32]|uniref:Phosphatidate cytidylyltransferase n=1 Tax=Caldilineaceae bacterium SB0661_bin_32 TaxID=2605255 RepID=A0A6B1DCT8_9CHLR|nr:hypothetical protein [Caldilineaceae bacterium SB0661_bin_32]
MSITVKRRVIAGLIALVPVLLALWYGGLWWVLLLTFFTSLGAYEYFVLIERSGYRPARWYGFAWTLALMFSFWSLVPVGPELVLTFGFIIIFVRILLSQQSSPPHEDSSPGANDPLQPETEAAAQGQDHKPFRNWALTVAGASYIGLMMGQALALRLLPNGLFWMLLGLGVTMVNDSAAYFVGVTIGRRRILPALSPKKSWEGTAGGWIAATLAGAAVAFWAPLDLAVWLGALIGLGGGILALFGDLAVSMLKRQIGVKDSGVFLPGHGGFLDRLDSIMFVLPFVYQMALLLGAA